MERFSAQQMKKADIVLLILIPIVAASISVFFHLPYFFAILVFFLPLAAWLTYRTPHAALRASIFSLAGGLLMGFLAEYVLVTNNAWSIPHSLFPRLFSVVTVEDVLFLIVLPYTVVMFYEHFLHKGVHNLIDSKMKYLLIPLSIVCTGLLFLAMNGTIITLPYAYVWFGLFLMALPVVTFLSLFPRHLSQYAKVFTYFAALLVIFEFVALQEGFWVFSGTEYIGWISIFHFTMPVEELFFWCILSATAVLAYYEFFDEKTDKKTA